MADHVYATPTSEHSNSARLKHKCSLSKLSQNIKNVSTESAIRGRAKQMRPQDAISQSTSGSLSCCCQQSGQFFKHILLNTAASTLVSCIISAAAAGEISVSALVTNLTVTISGIGVSFTTSTIVIAIIIGICLGIMSYASRHSLNCSWSSRSLKQSTEWQEPSWKKITLFPLRLVIHTILSPCHLARSFIAAMVLNSHSIETERFYRDSGLTERQLWGYVRIHALFIVACIVLLFAAYYSGITLPTAIWSIAGFIAAEILIGVIAGRRQVEKSGIISKDWLNNDDIKTDSKALSDHTFKGPLLHTTSDKHNNPTSNATTIVATGDNQQDHQDIKSANCILSKTTVKNSQPGIFPDNISNTSTVAEDDNPQDITLEKLILPIKNAGTHKFWNNDTIKLYLSKHSNKEEHAERQTSAKVK